MPSGGAEKVLWAKAAAIRADEGGSACSSVAEIPDALPSAAMLKFTRKVPARNAALSGDPNDLIGRCRLSSCAQHGKDGPAVQRSFGGQLFWRRSRPQEIAASPTAAMLSTQATRYRRSARRMVVPFAASVPSPIAASMTSRPP